MRGAVTMVLLEHALATTVFNILLENEPFVASSDVPFNGEITFEPHRFVHFRRTNITANSRSWLQLARRTAMSPVVGWSAYSLIIGIGTTLLTIALGVPAAYAFARFNFRGRHLLLLFTLLPRLVPSLGIMVPIYRLAVALGALDPNRVVVVTVHEGDAERGADGLDP